MEQLFAFIGNDGDVRQHAADTFRDNQNCMTTEFMLGIFAFLITAKDFVGEPISCWTPSHFTDAHVEYTNKVNMLNTIMVYTD